MVTIVLVTWGVKLGGLPDGALGIARGEVPGCANARSVHHSERTERKAPGCCEERDPPFGQDQGLLRAT